VASLALRDSAERLAAEVFNTFPSLYDMLPAVPGEADLFDARSWPAAGPQPRAGLLQAARAAREQLAPADARFAVIAGVGAQTVTGVARRGDDFLYTVTRHGDGTVPVASAELPGAPAVYARVAHSDLTRSPEVAAAVVELLRRGATQRLPRSRHSASRARATVSDRQLRRGYGDKVNWAALTPEERRLFLEQLNQPAWLRLRVSRPPRRRARRSSRRA
jgi:hypothetical protein